MSEIAILCAKGDLRLQWDRNLPDEVSWARAEVERLKAAGYSFFIDDGETPADEVTAGAGDLVFRRVDDPVSELEKPTENEPQKRGKKAVAIPRLAGGAATVQQRWRAYSLGFESWLG